MRVLSGNAAFTQINTRLLFLAQSTLDLPPVGTTPPPLATLVLDADIGAGDFDITYTGTPLATGDALYIRGAIVPSAGVRYVSNSLRFVGVSAGAQASPYDVETQFFAQIGTPNEGDTVHVFVSVVTLATGLLSVPLRDSAIVTST